MQERRRSGSVVQSWTSCRVQASFHVQSVCSTGAGSNSLKYFDKFGTGIDKDQ